MRRLFALAGALLLVSWSGLLRAQTSAFVYFGGACLPDGVEHGELLRILAAELSPSTVSSLESVAGTLGDAVVLGIDRCIDAPPSVRISVWRAAERRERIVVLADVPQEDRTRTLALALAETRLDPNVSRPAAPEPVPWVPPPRELAPPPPLADESVPQRRIDPDARNDTHFQFRTSVAFRYATATSTPAAGVFLGVGWPRAGLGATVFGARQNVAIGVVTLWVPTATAYYDVLRFSDRLRLRGTLDLGYAIASGAPRAPARAHTEGSFHAAIHGGVATTLWRNDPNDIEATVAVGYASSLRAQANGADAAGLDGLLFTASVGLGFR